MTRIRTLSRLCRWMTCLIASAALYSAPAGAAVAPPSAPAVSAGAYTVSYTRCSGCMSDWLEERTAGGTWKTVGSGPVAFSGKAPGTYYYRVAYWWYVSDPYFGYEFTEYSAEARVAVGSSVPALDPLDTQLRYRYETRVGDANADGRLDVFVNRTAGGQAGNGTVDKLLLLQNGAGGFSALVPSSTQLTAARSWPSSAIRVTLRDFNVDGFADVLLKGIGAAVGTASIPNQIVYASGQLLSLQPRGVRAVDADLRHFAADSREYFADSSYFTANAPIRLASYVVVYYLCEPWYLESYFRSCGWFPYYTTIAVPDYSVFEESALSAWHHEAGIEAGSETLDQGQAAIKTAYEQMLGVPIGGRDLGGVIGERGSADEPRYRRGLELFLAVFGIFDANADELEPKGETGRKADVVYVTGRKILGFLPRHTALEYGGSTLSAHDSDASWLGDGRLVSQLDWPSDNPTLMMTLGTVGSSLGASLYWGRLVAADRAYDDALPYDALPSIGNGGYNSNGYTHGLVLATAGTPSIDMARFVGGEKPVPASEFR